MASVIQKPPGTPRQAARRRARLDRLLDPELFKALSDPTRGKLLACAIKCGRPCSVTELAACCSIDFSMVARHLAALSRAGLLEAEKRGRSVYYTARSGELSQHLRELGDAIDEWGGACGCGRGCSGAG